MVKSSFEHTQGAGAAPVKHRDDRRDLLADKKFRHPAQLIVQGPITLDDQHQNIGKDGKILSQLMLHDRTGVQENQIVSSVDSLQNFFKGLGILIYINGLGGKQCVNTPEFIMKNYLIQFGQ